MSTKNLARTVIEGGRYYSNCDERRASHGRARAAERAVVGHARGGDDLDALVWPEARVVPKMFHDKLAPAERWLRSQAGRPWNRVRSEMFERFDTRTLAGRHIVFDHLLPSRWRHRSEWHVASGVVRFHVDAHGILRVREVRRKGRWADASYVPDAADALRFAAGRRVLRRGASLYWGVGIQHPGELAPSCFRQDRALTDAERDVLAALTEGARERIEIVYA